MKREDLEKLGLTKEQIDSVCDLNNKDMAPIKNDLQKVQDDLKVTQEKLKTAEDAVKKFDGVDLENKISRLKTCRTPLKRRMMTMPQSWLTVTLRPCLRIVLRRQRARMRRQLWRCWIWTP